MNNQEFIQLLHEACETENMDKYMIEKLHDVFPYDLVFKKGDD